MFMEREAKITRLFFAFLMFVWLGSTTSVTWGDTIQPENPSDNIVEIDNEGYTVNGKRYEFKNKNTSSIIYGGKGDTDGDVASNNSIEISNITDVNVASIHGGYSYKGEASNNKIYITNSIGTATLIYGGEGKKGKANEVSITNSKLGSMVIGGFTNDDNAENNNVILNNSQVVYIDGGNSANGSAINNIVTLNNGKASRIHGGLTHYGAEATNNVVTINDCEIKAYDETDNTSIVEVDGGLANNGNARENVVNINNGAIGGIIKAQITGGSAISGDSTNNIININGGTIIGTVHAGEAFNGSVVSNVINIRNNPVLDNATLYGYSNYSVAKKTSHSGNTLNVYSKNISAKSIANFDNINFYLDTKNNNSNVKPGDTMLTAETANIEGAKITGYVQGDTDLKEGDTVTLLEATTMNADDNTTYTGSVAEGISFNHELNVKRDGNKILATVGNSEVEPTISSASNNTVIVNDSTYKINDGEETSYSGARNVYGGMVGSVDSDNEIAGGNEASGNASNNTVKINSGDLRVISGGISTNGNANGNTVEISGGTISQHGELVDVRVSGGDSVSGNVSNNTVNVSGGTFLYGSLNGGTSDAGTVSNNTVNITGGSFLGLGQPIYGGYSNSGEVTNNTINISGSPTLDNAGLYGGRSTGGTVSGNTLNVRTKNIKVGTIAGFDNINFHLDTENNKSNVANGDTMLTAETANIEGTKITGYVQGDTDLKEGDTVTLLDAETLNADDNTTYTGSVAEGISFNHELKVKRDGNKILATVGERKDGDGGDGGDEPTPATGSASNNIVTVNDTTYKINDGEETSYSGSKNIYGGMVGAVDATDHIMGGNASSGDASSNTININSGDFSGANVYGGYASTGAASNNTINISGTSNLDNASIYGGYVSGETSSTNPLIVSSENSSPQATTASDIVVSYPDTTDSVGAASNNTINITDAPSLTGASIYGGYAANGGATSGNTLNIRTKNISAKSIGNFENINFYLDTDNNKSNVANGDTLLKVETADIQGAKITGLIAGDTNLSENDKVTLLEATNLNSDTNTTYASSIAEGISFKHKLDVMNEGNKITATVKSDTPELLEQTTVIPTAPVSAPKMVTAHIDNTLNWLPSEDFAMPSSGSSEKSSGDEEAEASKELGSDVQTEKPGYEIFGNIGASSLRTNTGNGSYVDSKTNGINLGFAKRFDSENGNRTYIAPLFDFGGGSYESHLASGIKGKGHTHFTTGGVIARRSLKNGTYFESSFRMGKTTMDFATDDLVQGDTHPHVAYNTSAPVWAAHLNVGRRINLSPKDVLNLYGIYFHTHQGGMDAKLTTGETYQFNSVTNQRLRVGARLLKWAKPTSCFYSGVAYQWESAGAANATYKNQTTHNVGASGSSFMIELGWQVKPAATSRIALDIGAVGWLGHQRGGSAHVKFNYSF